MLASRTEAGPMSRTGQEEQIIYALRQAEAGKKVGEICREMGVTSRRRFTVERRSDREVEPNPCRPRECRTVITPPLFPTSIRGEGPATHGSASDSMTIQDPVAFCILRRWWSQRRWDARAQTHVNSAMIVMLHTSVKARSSRGSWRTLTSGRKTLAR